MAIPAESPPTLRSGMPETPPTTGLRLCLRSLTAGAHARLDAKLGSLDLTALPGYRRFLEINAAALLPLERALERAGVTGAFPDWAKRTRRVAILQDIARLGGHAAPLAAPGPLDFGGMLGTLYVLEGSRLGARMLLKTVERSADLRLRSATAFLRHGQGEALWPSFLTALERYAARLRGEASAIDGALAAFGLFEQAAANGLPAGARADARLA